MSKYVCNYSAIRFLPYRETSEFVNIGIVVHCPELGFFGSRLAKRRSRRVGAFFSELNLQVYTAAVDALRAEFRKYRNGLGLFTEGRVATVPEVERGMAEFQRLIRRREGLVHFAQPGSRLVDDPEKAVGELYEYFVNRSFAQVPQYHEQVMRNRLDEWLEGWNLRGEYRVNRRVGDETFHLALPFVHLVDRKPVKALKPLDLNKPEPTEIYEHGDAWVQRMRRLRDHGTLPAEMIFTVQWPHSRRDIADEIVADLRGLDCTVLPFARTDELRDKLKITE